MKRIAGILSTCGEPPERILWHPWGPDGYDPEKKDGWDVRDVLTQKATALERVQLVDDFIEKVTPIPADWVEGRTASAAARGGTEVNCLECSSWDELYKSMCIALQVTEGLKAAFICILSSVASVKLLGDSQLWMKIIGPPACGKSTLCDAIATNKKYVRMLSVLTGFHSGYKSDREGKQDNSLIPQIDGMAVIVKDGNTLMTHPNKQQILGEGRDLYDGSCSNWYKHGVSRSYAGHRMSLMICGTASLKELDSSEFGARQLDIVVMEEIDEQLEDDIMWRAVNRTARNMLSLSDGTFESRHDPQLMKFYQLTGGYITFLRENIEALMARVEVSEESMRKIMDYARFISYLRARPSLVQDEIAERELATRLSSQLMRLALSSAVVLNKTKVDKEIMALIRKTCLDTSRGKTLDLAKVIYSSDADGCAISKLAIRIGETAIEVGKLLRFLMRIGAVEHHSPKIKGIVVAGHSRWRFTDRFSRLFESVMGT